MSTRRLRLLVVAAGAVLTTLLTGPAPGLAASSPAPGTPAARAAQMAKAKAAFKATVASLDPYVVRAADGTLSLQAPGSVTSGIDPNVLGHLRLNLANVDSLIRAGKLASTSDHRLFEPNRTSLAVQEVNAVFFYWWGFELWADHDVSGQIESYLHAVADGFADCAFIAALFGDDLIATICGGFAAYLTSIADVMAALDVGNGTVSDWVAYSLAVYIWGQ